jgi:hypothetical protein
MKERIYDEAYDHGVDIEVRCLEAFPSSDFSDVYQMMVKTKSASHVREVKDDVSDEELSSKMEALAGVTGDSDD